MKEFHLTVGHQLEEPVLVRVAQARRILQRDRPKPDLRAPMARHDVDMGGLFGRQAKHEAALNKDSAGHGIPIP